jgi:hypothetical protein
MSTGRRVKCVTSPQSVFFAMQKARELLIFEKMLCDNGTLSIDTPVKENYHGDRP